LLQFGLNYHNEGKGANAVSYFAFIAIMIMGALAAPCLLVQPSTVIREDGSQVSFQCADDPMEEIRAALRSIGDPFVRSNLLFFLASNWFYTYNFSGFNGHQFNMRTRGLNSALFWGAQMFAAWLFGKLLDAKLPPMTRARRGLAVVVYYLAASLGLALWNNFRSTCNHGLSWDKGSPCTLDFLNDFPSVGVPMAINVMLGASDAIYQNFALWLMSMAAAGDARKAVTYAAAYKGVQSLGAGLAWALDLAGFLSYRQQGVLTLVLAIGACAPVARTFSMLETSKHEAAP